VGGTLVTARLLLIRHGESTANVAAAEAEAVGAEAIAVEAGDADVPLSPLGRAQAATLAKAVRDHDASEADWFSSPYRRALQTAQAAGVGRPALREGSHCERSEATVRVEACFDRGAHRPPVEFLRSAP
jgi:phosphohistidine phosphatase SixA